MNPIRSLFLGAVLSAAAAGVTAQDIEAGQLLIARPSLEDPTFTETVLLLLDHTTEGTLGVALNRPTWVKPADAFPELDALSGYPGTLYMGGPASPTQLLILLETDNAGFAGTQPIFGRVRASGNLDMLRDLDLAAPGAPRLRLYAGFAAWAPGQLASEIAAGSWRLQPATADQVFTTEPESLWRRLPSSGDGVSAALGPSVLLDGVEEIHRFLAAGARLEAEPVVDVVAQQKAAELVE